MIKLTFSNAETGDTNEIRINALFVQVFGNTIRTDEDLELAFLSPTSKMWITHKVPEVFGSDVRRWTDVTIELV